MWLLRRQRVSRLTSTAWYHAATLIGLTALVYPLHTSTARSQSGLVVRQHPHRVPLLWHSLEHPQPTLDTTLPTVSPPVPITVAYQHAQSLEVPDSMVPMPERSLFPNANSANVPTARHVATFSTPPQVPAHSRRTAGLLGGGLELVVGVTQGTVDVEQIAVATGVGSIGAQIDQWTGVDTHTVLRRSTTGVGQRSLLWRVSYSTVDKLSPYAGTYGGGALTAALFSYGAYFAGRMDLRTANRSMIGGTISSAATTGWISLVGSSGGAAAIGFIAAWSVAKCYRIQDEMVERKRIGYLLDNLINHRDKHTAAP